MLIVDLPLLVWQVMTETKSVELIVYFIDFDIFSYLKIISTTFNTTQRLTFDGI